MRHFVIASVSTGTLLRSCYASGADDTELLTWAGEGEVVVFTENPVERLTDWRVVDGVVVAREVLAPSVSTTTITADSMSECVISDLPDPCRVALQGLTTAPPTEVTGGSITLTASTPGEIKVLVLADPTYKPWETTIHAV